MHTLRRHKEGKNMMKVKTIVSILFILVVTILYFFGFCQWDMPIYILCIAIAITFMAVSLRQQKKYHVLLERQDYVNNQ